MLADRRNNMQRSCDDENSEPDRFFCRRHECDGGAVWGYVKPRRHVSLLCTALQFGECNHATLAV